MLLAVPQGPADLRLVRLGPPTVELREIQAAVDKHFHPTRSTGFPGPPWRVHPHINATHEVLGQEQVVVRDEDHPSAHLGATNELDPRPDQLLPEAIGRMRLSRDDELDRARRVRSSSEFGATARPRRSSSTARRPPRTPMTGCARRW